MFQRSEWQRLSIHHECPKKLCVNLMLMVYLSFLGLGLSLFIGRAYAQPSDHEALFSLSEKEGGNFRRQTVLLSRSLDLSPLYDEHIPLHSSLDFIDQSRANSVHSQTKQNRLGTRTSNEENERLEEELIKALERWPNLIVTSPSQYRRSLSEVAQYKRLQKLAQEFIRESKSAYKEVDLERTRALLDSAIELWTQSRYSLMDPVAFGSLYLKRGVVAVEQDQLLSASLDFRRALLLAPHLRLKSGFDTESAVKIFNETLDQLRELKPQELAKLSERREWVDERSPTLSLIKVKDDLFTVLWRSAQGSTPTVQDWGIREQSQLNSEVAIHSLMSRLASKIWLCLPMRHEIDRDASSLKQWNLSAGWGIATPIKSPVSLITLPGFLLESSLRALSQLETKLGISLTNSALDESRDLTSSFTMTSVYFGPLWVRIKRNWWSSIGLMFEGTYLGSTAVTRAVGCKFFDLSSSIPNEICDPKRDIREIQSAWRIGPRAQLNAGTHIGRYLTIALQVFGSVAFYQSTEHPFLYPIGAGVLIGYSFNSR